MTMTDKTMDAMTGTSLGVFASVSLTAANQCVSLLVGLGTLVVLGLRISALLRKPGEPEESEEE